MTSGNPANSNASQTNRRAEPERILIAIEGEEWFIRHVNFVEHKLDFNRKLYHCDGNLGGPFLSIEDAVKAVNEMLHHRKGTASCFSA